MKTDAVLQQDIIAHFRSNIYLTGPKITVFVVRGSVQLCGNVSSQFKHSLIHHILQHVEGIRKIEDHLIILESRAKRNYGSNPFCIE